MAKKKVHVEYSVERELTEEFALILAENPRFFALKEKLVIATCFLVRMDEDGTSQPGKGKRVTIKKVPPEMQVLIKTTPNFVLVVDFHWWGEASPQERRGTITKVLSRIRFEESEDGIKTGLQKWDVEEMFSNLEHSGVYDEVTLRLKEIMSTATSRLVDVAAHGLKTAAADAAVEEQPEDEERPRVVARAVPPKPAAKKKEAEPTRPPRKIPVDAPEPDPEPEPESED